MRKSVVLKALLSLLILVGACDEKEVQQISKNGAIETTMTVNHLDDNHDVIITTHNIWIKNQLAKKIEYRDTIPALGSTVQEAENHEGLTKSVSLKKDFEIYITVK